MQVSNIRPYSVAKASFKGNGNKSNEYENPINRNTERNLSILSTVGVSTIVGLSAAGLSTCFPTSKKTSGVIGLLTGAASLALLLPSKIYNTKVNSYVKEKEMGVYNEQTQAKQGIYGEINKEIKNEDVSLDDKINHFTTVQMANNGKGLLVKGE